MGFFGPHKHSWFREDCNPVSDADKRRAAVITYRCYRCGSIRYDKIDGGGFVSAVVTDSTGAVTLRSSRDDRSAVHTDSALS